MCLLFSLIVVIFREMIEKVWEVIEKSREMIKKLQEMIKKLNLCLVSEIAFPTNLG